MAQDRMAETVPIIVSTKEFAPMSQSCCVSRNFPYTPNGSMGGFQMSIRKRKWTTAAGEPREAWIVDYANMYGPAARCKTEFQDRRT
jgi:hypothetical protein